MNTKVLTRPRKANIVPKSHQKKLTKQTNKKNWAQQLIKMKSKRAWLIWPQQEHVIKP